MNWKRIFWPVLRVTYFVCCIIDITMMGAIVSPLPNDGNGVRVIVGLLLINTLTLVIGWAFIPWPRPELDPPKPAPVPEPAADLEDISGQQGLEDYLEKRRREGVKEDYQETYQDYWKGLVETDGKLDPDKVMRELHDYKFMLDQVPKVYCHVSGGMISKPNTYAFEVINKHDEQREKDIEEAIKEEHDSQDIPGEDA